ncbi:MAG: Mrp/NBP35 family ATP-binding protein [Spirochaetes bacterium]|nr:Mrp/NBP35 family ATP-binding protein [Spirochaetota bacterium]
MDREKQMKEQDKRIDRNLKKIKHKLIVMSGKGGVGKSTMAVNLAVSLSGKGYSAGLLDVDLHGPNTLKMLNIEDEKIISDGQSMLPIKYSDNLKVISIAALLDQKDAPVIWRGPLKMGVIRQFIADVKWDDLDWLIVDSPPGTGDEPLTVAQIMKGSKAVLVTTPQEISLMDVRKSVHFSNKLDLPIVGIIENMSGLICPHCYKKINLFKSGGGKKMADSMKIDFLGSIPLDEKIMESTDSGIPYFTRYKDSAAGIAFNEIVDKIIQNEIKGGK